MNAHKESIWLRNAQLIRFVKELDNGNQTALAKRVGIHQPTMSEYCSYTRTINDDAWALILSAYNVPDAPTPEDYHAVEDAILARETHDGQKLKNYLKNKNITGKDAAAKLDVTPPAISTYYRSEQFTPEVYEKVKRAFPDFNEDAEPYRVLSKPRLPYAKESERIHDLRKLPNYDSGLRAEDYDLTNALVVKVETDLMEPEIRQNSDILAVLVDPKKYKYHLGKTVLHYEDKIAIGSVFSNDLFDKGYITLHRGKDSVLRVAPDDIQHLWHIVLALNVKL